jgi:UDP-2,4-diacetamido-2,4,6-trideoxy-beta-L-altropyranose hydrolase
MTGGGVKIAIRADASTLIGTGHIRRCQSLATALRDVGGQVRFVCRDTGLDYVPCFGEEPVLLPASQGDFEAECDAPPHGQWLGVTQLQDARDFVAAMQQWRPDWVMVDHYAIDARWHKIVRGALGCRIAVIDDLGDRTLDADVVIDHNSHPDHIAKYNGRLLRPSIMACGPAYAMIDKQYAAAARYQFNDEVRSIGIFMGGTDAVNASIVALQAVVDTGFLGEVEIVTTSANPNLANLRRKVDARPRTRITIDLPNLAAFFARHDLQIGAGGGATWERFCIGAPTIAVATADNQRDGVIALSRAGFLFGVDCLRLRLISDALRNALFHCDLRKSMAKNSESLVDGLGASRAAQRIVPMRSLRPATLHDAMTAFQWRNARSVRMLSNNRNEIDWNEHLNWWHATLDDPQRFILILEMGATPVGVLRYDVMGDEALVSIYLDPEKINRGLGQELLMMGEEWLRQNCIHVERLAAKIHDDNQGSIRAFLKAGFKKCADGSYERAIAPDKAS